MDEVLSMLQKVTTQYARNVADDIVAYSCISNDAKLYALQFL